MGSTLGAIRTTKVTSAACRIGPAPEVKEAPEGSSDLTRFAGGPPFQMKTTTTNNSDNTNNNSNKKNTNNTNNNNKNNKNNKQRQQQEQQEQEQEQEQEHNTTRNTCGAKF
jgi:hypothetical protein